MRCTLYNVTAKNKTGYPGCTRGKEPACRYKRPGRHGLDSWVRKILWRRKGYPLQYSCLETLWTEKPSRLQFHGSQRARHDRATEHRQHTKNIITFKKHIEHGKETWCHRHFYISGSVTGGQFGSLAPYVLSLWLLM